MPRFSEPSSAVVADLIAQARFSPRAVLLKQTENAEALTGEIEAHRRYPEDWLVFRVSGYTPDMKAPRLILGSELLADLSSFVEHLTGLASLSDADAQSNGLGIAELSQRWGVTRRTLERYRRSGLVARRVVDPSARGRVRLVFSDRAVEAFERRRPAQAAGSARDDDQPALRSLTAAKPPRRPKRLPPGERSDLLARAAAHRQQTGASLDACAAMLARESGRSKSTLRRWLESDAATPVTTAGTRDRSALALRAQRAGIAMSSVAARLGLSVPAVHRLITIARAEALLRVLPDSAVLPAELDSSVRLEPHPLLSLDAAPVTAWEVAAVDADEPSPMPADAERALAHAHAALLQRAITLASEVNLTRPDPAKIDEAETAYRGALRLKRQLLRAAIPLIRRTIAQHASAAGHAGARDDLSLYRRCLRAACEAIDAYVPKPSGRLAARISLSLARELAAKSAPTEQMRDTVLLYAATPRHLTPPPWVVRGLDTLHPREMGIIGSRFGTHAEPPQTFAAIIAAHPGLTPAAWWSMYRKAARAVPPAR